LRTALAIALGNHGQLPAAVRSVDRDSQPATHDRDTSCTRHWSSSMRLTKSQAPGPAAPAIG